jgi:hypothetical protein
MVFDFKPTERTSAAPEGLFGDRHPGHASELDELKAILKEMRGELRDLRDSVRELRSDLRGHGAR